MVAEKNLLGKSIVVAVDNLKPGLYVDIGLKWTAHPFLFRRFRISDYREIAIIRSLVSEVRVFPARSVAGVEVESVDEAGEGIEQLRAEYWEQKEQRVRTASSYREKRRQMSKRYNEIAHRVRGFNQHLKFAPTNALQEAGALVEKILVCAERRTNVVIGLINLPDSDYGDAGHALNITVLALSIGNRLNLCDADMYSLALGALLHDIGKSQLPASLYARRAPLTHSERILRESHVCLGTRLLEHITDNMLPGDAKRIVAEHHEMIDGSGFPHKLKGPQVSKLAQIVAIANVYDNLCNPNEVSVPLNPKAAMATLYSKYSGRLDAELIDLFVKTMGVYPPGTLVRLSDESVGLVVNVDPTNLLKPNILLYNADVPKDEALMISLADSAGLTISDVIQGYECPEGVKKYLGLQGNLAYFFTTAATS